MNTSAVPCFAWSARYERDDLAPGVETSSASRRLVGPRRKIRARGEASAISTRWHCPPESWNPVGGRPAGPVSGGRRLERGRRGAARRSAAARRAWRGARRTARRSSISGLSAVSGSLRDEGESGRPKQRAAARPPASAAQGRALEQHPPPPPPRTRRAGCRRSPGRSSTSPPRSRRRGPSTAARFDGRARGSRRHGCPAVRRDADETVSAIDLEHAHPTRPRSTTRRGSSAARAGPVAEEVKARHREEDRQRSAGSRRRGPGS